MAKLLFLGGRVHLLDGNGNALSGGKVNFYDPGTTTRKDTFTTSLLTTANANPVILDSNGRASIHLNGDYKVVLTDSADVTIYTEDNINPDESSASSTFNFALNGSFEDNALGDSKTPDAWVLTEQSGSTQSLDTADPIHGEQAMKFISTGSGGGDVISTAFFEVTPLRHYEMSFMLKSSVVDVRNLVQVHWYTAARALISSTTIFDDSTTNPTNWSRRSAVALPPPTARYAKLQLYGCHSSDATSGNTLFDDVQFRALSVTWPRGHLSGLGCSNGTDASNDIDIAVGECVDSGNADLLRLESILTKQIDAAWAAGTAAGGLFSGATALPSVAGTTYHLFLIKKDVDGTIDAGFDSSVSCANIPSGYTRYRRVMSVVLTSGDAIIAFLNNGDNFTWDVPQEDAANSTGSTARVTQTLTLPLAIKTKAHINVHVQAQTTSTSWLFGSMDQTDTAPSGTVFFVSMNSGDFESLDAHVFTNTSAQMATRCSRTDGLLFIHTIGYIDARGRT